MTGSVLIALAVLGVSTMTAFADSPRNSVQAPTGSGVVGPPPRVRA